MAAGERVRIGGSSAKSRQFQVHGGSHGRKETEYSQDTVVERP